MGRKSPGRTLELTTSQKLALAPRYSCFAVQRVAQSPQSCCRDRAVTYLLELRAKLNARLILTQDLDTKCSRHCPNLSFLDVGHCSELSEFWTWRDAWS